MLFRSKLPIPFRAVATDIETGDMVVMGRGDLAESMRASMAVPGIYPPVPIGNRLLADGGISRNLAVDVARKMGADVVIAVNIGTPLAQRNDLGDVFSVSLQVLKIFGNQNVADSIAQLTTHDVLIQPDMGDIGATDFDRMGEAIKLGEQQSYDLLSKFPSLQLSPADYAHYQELSRRRPLPPLRIDFVDVEGNQQVPAELIRARFGIQPGTPWNVTTLNDSLRHVYDLGYFQRVDAVLQQTDGKTGLKLQVTEKPDRKSVV